MGVVVSSRVILPAPNASKLLSPGLEQEVHASWSQVGGWGALALGRGSPQAVPTEPQVARLAPGFLVLWQEPRSTGSAVFPNQKSSPFSF